MSARLILCEFQCVWNSEHDWRGRQCYKCGAQRSRSASATGEQGSSG